MKTRILDAASAAGKNVTAAVADRIGVADSKATGSVQWTRTSVKVRAGGIVVALAAMANEVANPALSNVIGTILLQVPLGDLTGFEQPLGIILAAIAGYLLPVVTGYYTREPDTSIKR